MDNLLVRLPGKGWHVPAGAGYARESDLQALLAEHPELIPGLRSSDAQVCREFQSGVGPADLVVLEPDGRITLVECKLAYNREARREIIGQVLDYGSRLWQMPVDEFEMTWVRLTGQSPFTNADDVRPARAEVEENLRRGRFQIILAVDEINDDLKRIVEYLNAITLADITVIAVEYRRLHDDGVEILQPQVFGEELARVKARAGGARSRSRWDRDAYLQWLDPDQIEPGTPLPDHVADRREHTTVTDLLRVLDGAGFVLEGGVSETPSLSAGLVVDGRKLTPVYLFTREDHSAWLQFPLSNLKQTPEVRDRVARILAELDGLAPALSYEEIRAADYAKRPRLRVEHLTSQTAVSLGRAIAEALAPVTRAIPAQGARDL